jgi:hypothetical protein
VSFLAPMLRQLRQNQQWQSTSSLFSSLLKVRFIQAFAKHLSASHLLC